MKKAMDKLFSVDKKIVLFLFFIIFIGLLTGSLFMTILDSSDKKLVSETLSSFLENVEPNHYLSFFLNHFLVNLLFILIIWILGFSVIGLPIVIILLFYKSFTISFSISSFIANYRWKGILWGFLYNFPHQIILLILYLYIGCYAIKVSSILLLSIIQRKKLDFKIIMNRYLSIFLLSFLIVIFMTVIETFFTPYLFKTFLNFFFIS